MNSDNMGKPSPHMPRKNQTLKHRNFSYLTWGTILVIILSTAVIRIPLLPVPLERDEGEYAYMGQLILQGVPPYAEAYNMKMPGIYAAYALLLAVFGQTHTGIHLGLLVINLLTIILLFFLGRRLLNPFAGVVAAGSFAVMSMSRSVQGIFANAEHFVILPAIGGILLLMRAVNSKRLLTYFLSGLLCGLAFVIKQHSGAFILFGGLYILYHNLRYRPISWSNCTARLMLFSVGALLPFGLACLFLWQVGVFGKFWFWAFVYSRKYISSLPLSTGVEIFVQRISRIVNSSLILWGLVGVGIPAFLWNKKVRPKLFFIAALLIFSFLAIAPGFFFRPHYFILFLPVASLLAGIAGSSIFNLFSRVKSNSLKKGIPVLIVFIALLHPIYKQRRYLFQSNLNLVSRMTYGANPFPESLEIADYIQKNSSKRDRIAVIGAEPQICFYSKRHSATGYLYIHELLKNHEYVLRMQQEMIQEIESAKPLFIIFTNFPNSWLVEPESEKLIFSWFEQYQREYYQLAGMVEILSPEKTVYLWREKAIGYSPRSPYWIAVYKRKET